MASNYIFLESRSQKIPTCKIWAHFVHWVRFQELLHIQNQTLLSPFQSLWCPNKEFLSNLTDFTINFEIENNQDRRPVKSHQFEIIHKTEKLSRLCKKLMSLLVTLISLARVFFSVRLGILLGWMLGQDKPPTGLDFLLDSEECGLRLRPFGGGFVALRL